ncbi:MAG: dihydroneopterin aldolase family protein [Candidatus Thermoplasmatota archaeon]|nr:dihydroneopterin aldolase family protein [Candidatus Thermoplasmatota archaeon]
MEKKKTESDKTSKKMKEGEKYFDCTDKERISFELGIKLGALFHQFIGTPVSSKNLKMLEDSIEKTTESQAFVKSAEVKINAPRSVEENEVGPFRYTTLTEEMIEAEVVVRYKNLKAVGKMEYIDEMSYPLMYIESIEKI